jgi:hypothetical protein
MAALTHPIDPTTTPQAHHPSPPPGLLAIVFTALFCSALLPVTTFGGTPHFPGPWESPQTIATFFQLRTQAARLCAFLQFGSAIPLGIFTATIYSRLNFLGVRAAGATIALCGGFAATASVASCALVLWTMTRPGIPQDPSLTHALYLLSYALGGPGYSVPLGLLMAGVSIPVLAYRLAPRWIPILGLILAAAGFLSWLNLEFASAVVLIPLTRFPGFLWMIAIGFALPASKPALRPQDRSVSHA